jgi:hypothetical protein
VRSPDRMPIDVFEPILCYLMEAREASLHAGLSATTGAIERAIVMAAREFRPRPRAGRLRVVGGLHAG